MVRKKRDTLEKKNIIDRSTLNRICFSYMIFSMLIIATALPPVIRVGAIFTEDERESSIESAFKYAIYRINKEKNLLPNTQLVYDIEYVPRDDSFRTTKKVCRQLEAGVQAIFGPTDALLAGHVQSICEAYDIPHIEVRIDLEYSSKEFSINLYPSHTLLTLAYRDIMMYLNWTKVAIIYEEDYGLFNLMQSSTETKAEMYIRQASPDSYRQVLRAIRQKEIYKIIVDTNPSNIKTFFKSILQLQMNDHRYHYMFTTFDLETYDLEDFRYNSVNITAFRLVDVNSKRYLEVIDQMQRLQHNGLQRINGIPYIQTESALMFDSVYAFASGLHFLNLDSRPNFSVKNLSCTSDQTWDDGISLYNQINAAITDGLTGNINFVEGRRDKFKLDILKLKQEKIQKVGYWQPEVGINISDPTAFYDSNIANITLVVMTREERPYVMVKEDTNLTGNIRFEGFCIDLLKAIAQQVGFQYKIELVPDNMYGVYIPETNSWNGIVQELMERRADLAVASMTINYARESVIDFTKPFMNLGIGILFKVPTSQPTRLFSFMNPLAIEIWLYVLAAYILVSLALFVMARFSPYEWKNPHPCFKETDIVENQFSISNSFWFITGTFLRQGSGLNPKDSKIGIYQKMWRYMENRKAAVFVKTYEDGIKRVMEGSYAFLMESTMLDYAVQRDCNLTQIGGLLDSKGYGIATPKGSPWRDKISLAILELQEKGIIQILYDKWWKNTGDVCNRDDKSKESKANALGVENIGGVFVVLLCGLALAVVVAIFEFCWNSRKNLNTENQSLCSEMAQELRFAMHCHGSKSKHRPRKRNCLKCSSGPTYVPSNMSIPNVGVHYNYFN
ncbi:glutamate receptor ionotropic, kainate 2 isoform X6 [Drosophila biarmipes]|uniref:glutamate receptor ionotropic, kainate 2 isoform X6 n=1 Tax=Drosophila biarmipes TaxID=125945 RepID=UPI0007E72FD8|nr:glutamate receptor ionotropic, kainate 2 isoform X6 [Drosophila biarmipes]